MRSGAKPYDKPMNKRVADWARIKNEYLSTHTTTRELAKKYKVSASTIMNHCAKEHWNEQKEQIKEQVERKVCERAVKHQIDTAERAMTLLITIMDKIEDGIASVADGDAQSLKTYVSCIKDMKDIGLFKAELDKQEQLARIAKLKHDCEEQKDKSVDVNITFGNGADTYAD